MITRLLRRGSAAAGALGLMLVAAAPTVAAAAAEDGSDEMDGITIGADDAIRTDPGAIAGYNLIAEAAPVTWRVFDPFIPIPADPGDPNFSVTAGYSLATLGAGPVSRAVSSLLWPGPGIGDGFGVFAEEFGMEPGEEYPIRAGASYPGGEQSAQQETVPGGGMHAVAKGLDVEAVTDFGGDLIPTAVTAGSGRSVSRTTVEDGVATATAESSLNDLVLLEGLITLDGLRTRLVATTDGVEATVEGATDITGLTVAGTRYAVGRDGIYAESDDEDSPFSERPTLPLRLLGVVDLRDLIGVTVESGLVEDLEEEDGLAGAGRRAEGVAITLDFSLLFDLVNLLPADLVLEQLPDDIRGPLGPVLRMSPVMEIGIGYAEVEVAATEALTFEVPDLPPPPPAGGLADIGDFGSGALETPGDFGGDLGGTGDLGPLAAAPPTAGEGASERRPARHLGPIRAGRRDAGGPAARPARAPVGPQLVGARQAPRRSLRGRGAGRRRVHRGGAARGRRPPGVRVMAAVEPAQPDREGPDVTQVAIEERQQPWYVAARERVITVTRTVTRSIADRTTLDGVLALIATLLIPAGVVAIVLGWSGASRTPFVFEQIPYMISGGTARRRPADRRRDALPRLLDRPLRAAVPGA